MSDFDLDALLDREPEHPSELALDEWIAGVLGAARAAEVEAHCAGCAQCQAHVTEARRGLAAVPGLNADAMFARILAGAEAAKPAPAAAEAKPGLLDRLKGFFDLRGLALVATGAAAAALIFVVTRPGEGVDPPPIGADPDLVRVKGSLALEVARKTADGAQPMVSGDVFRPDDEIRFVATLPEAGRVAIVGVEGDGTLYTAWPLPGHHADPVLPAGKAQALPGAVRLDGEPGRETLHLVLCPADVEPTCTSAGPKAAPRCPAACRTTAFELVKEAPMRLLAALVLLLGLVTPAAALPENTWVLAIGNNHGDPDEIGLLYAEDDARTMIEALHDVGGVPSGRITLMAGEKADAVRRKLVDLKAEIARDAGTGPSALVVYYSGHSDANALHLDGTHLPLLELVESVKAAGTRTRLLLLDACRSGGASRVKGVQMTASFEMRFVEAADVEGMAVITSSTARESSLESDRLRGSFFTHYFVAGLRGAADADSDARVTLDEAYDYAYHETVRASGRTESLQHPTFAVDMKGKGAMVLSRLDADARLAQLVLDEPALYLVSDANDGRLVAELKPPRAEAHVALPARRYTVQHRRPDAYFTYDVNLRPGSTVALKGLKAEATRYDRLVRKGGGERVAIHGLGVMAAYRDAVVDGEPAAPHLILEYGVDTRWLTPTLRVRGARYEADGEDQGLARTHTELGVGLTLQRFVDLDWISLSFGILGEAAWHQHEYAADRPTRTSWTGSFGALLAVERILYGGLSLRVEGGPLATVLETSRVEAGAEVETGVSTVANAWLAAGLRWRL